MNYRRILVLLAACLLWASSCFASDMRFVDANGYTGYYVDASSVSYESVAACDATIAVIKADRNRMFCYTMHFDRGRGVYQILSSQVLRYDPKEVLSTGGAETAVHPYGIYSPMKEIVDFIYNDLPHGDLPPAVSEPAEDAVTALLP